MSEKVKKLIQDLATLEVASFTGSDIGNLKPEVDDKGALKSSELFNSIRKKLATAELVGYSRFELEGDAINYTNNSVIGDQQFLLDGHNGLVEAAQKTRKDLFDFVIKAGERIMP